MMDEENISYVLVEDGEALKRVAEKWKNAKVLAIDLEMENHLHRYGTHLALIQVSDGNSIWLIDPLKISDLSPFCEMMKDENIQKVFHDPDFDLRVLDMKISCHPKNIFDTKTACNLLGKEEESLSGILENMFGIKKDTKMQKVDWTRRPLTKRMLDYAAKDVFYLIRVRDALESELKANGRMTWAEEEFKLLEKIRHEEKEKPYLFKGAKMLSGREKAILHTLYDCRDEIARKRDIPVFRVMSNKKLLELAKNPPEKYGGWKGVEGVSWLVKKYAWKFADAVKRGMRNEPEERQEKPFHRMPIGSALFEQLREERNAVSEKLKIKPHIIMSTSQMEEIARGTEPRDVLKKWQYEVLTENGVKFK
ncbi:MAG: ribonuclease D [Candidatus Micrarchaeota archaeon]|nr:ribonuclease D [Candidatus Micrarchaeota archaeon]